MRYVVTWKIKSGGIIKIAFMKKKFKRIRKLKDYRIHREGTSILVVAFLVFALVNAPLWYFFPQNVIFNSIVSLVSLVVYLLMVNFFRSPKRIFPGDVENVIVAPADGKVLEPAKGNVKGALLVLGGLVVLSLVRCIDSTNCDFVRWFMNTLTIAAFCAVIQTIMQLSVSYTLSRMRFKGRKLIMNVVLVLGMFPGFLTMIVLYYLLKMLGLTQAGAIPGLILISCASSGMGYYISKGFFDTVPKSLDESARIDGATRFQVFLKIIMPMAKPIVIYTILMAFMGPWGDYVMASYVAFGHKASYNVAVGLYRWVNTNDYQGFFTRFCAGGVLVAIPITALFMALQKYYVEGVTGGAVKG